MTDPNYTEQARALLAPDHVEVIARLLAERADLRQALEITKEESHGWARLAAERRTERDTAKTDHRKALDVLSRVQGERDAMAAKVRELEARPVLTRDLAMVALSRAGSPDFVAAMATAFMAEIGRRGTVTLPETEVRNGAAV